MKNDSETMAKLSSSPKFAKTAREWILASALYDGIEDEDIRQIEMLVSERGANPNVLLPEYGISPFHLVVANESTTFAVRATDLCLQHGADPNVRSEDGLTPVHLAAMWGCVEVLHLLLASGGNPWLVDDLGLNAFHYAIQEKQHKCYQLLKTLCNSQPKQSGCQKSPYHLNLKRVILYKNDLQIVYEASPSSAQKSTSTQTSPNAPRQASIEGTTNGLKKKNCSSKTELVEKDGNFQHHDSPVTSKLKSIIETHRRNSTLFEYSPSNERKSSLSSGVDSWKCTDQSDAVMTCYSELVSKLNEFNRIRQSLKESDGNDLLKKITQRKVPCATPKPYTAPPRTSNSTCDSSFCDKSNQYDVPKNEIAFVQDSTKANSTLDDGNSQLNESSPSIGFILDNLSDLCNQDNSLFSDIASDIDAFTTPVQNDVENMTEDEVIVISSTENTLNDSVYPFVSCENTAARESNEEFVTCRNSESFLEGIKNKQEPPAIVDALNNYFEKNPRSSTNSEVFKTSTPEKPARGSKENTFLSVLDDPNTGGGKCDGAVARKLSWVEAQVVSSDEEPYISISEEYEYTDLDEGVVLIEKRYLTKDISMSASGPDGKGARESSSSECESVSTLSGSEGAYETDDLRRALVQHGFVPGPITGNTKRVYLRKLKRCRRKPQSQPSPDSSLPAFSTELLKTLAQPCEHLLAEWSHLEDSMTASFTCARRPWREGQAKTSFTYLLLDPRVSHNLPARAATDPTLTHTLWGEFLRSVFYVGKGKRSRPYSHLYQAVAAWQQKEYKGSCKKIQRILDIWRSGDGVICLHIFLNVIPVEAFTREAAMICALTLPQLTNEQVGKFYGSAASWNERLKRRLGCVLLHRAFKVFLAEGERQLRPADID
ncbi:uncharacterized protein LOC129001420 [Macrosteles quadrilineatus]|uniref:uncharacterized protein LOC129001420 n=1 Tax=Macrosteles quadrilineatus TaxID=74068 RepID=UPI0023E114C3|nr:uncharacterized protein LOC129001420 [Macrosteles quadrilineatus]